MNVIFAAMPLLFGAATVERDVVVYGSSPAALARIDALKAEFKDDGIEKARVEATETAIKRFGQKVAPAPTPAPEKKVALEKKAAAPAAKPVEKK